MRPPTQVVKVIGMEDLQETLKGALPREATNILRRTTYGLAGVVAEKMKARAPRRTGKFAKSIKRKRNRGTKTMIEASVVAESSKKLPGYRWHWFEFGTKKMSPRRFIVPTVEEIRPTVNGIFRQEFGVQYEREMAKRNKKRK
jgi:HK97 gp10 family phage protein